jgi:hypothetical protein
MTRTRDRRHPVLDHNIQSLKHLHRNSSSTLPISTPQQILVNEIQESFQGKQFKTDEILLILSGSVGKHYHAPHYSDVDIVVVNMGGVKKKGARLDLERLKLLTDTTQKVITNLSNQGIYVVAFPQAVTEAPFEDLARLSIAHKKSVDPRNLKIEMLQCLFYPNAAALGAWEEMDIIQHLFANGRVLVGDTLMKDRVLTIVQTWHSMQTSDGREKVIRAEANIANSYILSTANIHLPQETLVRNGMRANKEAALMLGRSYLHDKTPAQLKSFDVILDHLDLLPAVIAKYVKEVSRMRNISPFDVRTEELENLHTLGEEAAAHFHTTTKTAPGIDIRN